jgi:hypothetical protein
MRNISQNFALIFMLSVALALKSEAQNVGVGTPTPTDPLTVRSTAGFGISQETFDKVVRLGFFTSTTDGAILQTHTNHDLKFATNNSSAQMVLQKATGNVGIGTDNPAAKLHIRGTGAERLRIENQSSLGNNVTSAIIFRTGNFFTGSIQSIGTSSNAARLGFYTGAQSAADEMSERVSISDNGNVGIGTVTPQHPLTFNSVLGEKISFWGGTVSSIAAHYGIGIANSAMQIYSGGMGDDIVFGYGRSASFTENMRIKGNGNVGIGTNPTLGGLVVNTKAGAVNAMFGSNTTGVAIETDFPGIGLNTYFNAGRKYIANGFGGLLSLNPSNGDFYIINTAASGNANAAANASTRLLINKDGNVGIGTGNAQPTARLHVNGSFRLANGTEGQGRKLVSDATGAATWRIDAYGAVSAYSEDNLLAEQFGFVDNTFYPAPFIKERLDVSNLFNPASAQYTVPETGYYRIYYTTPLRSMTDLPGSSCVISLNYQAEIRKNNVTFLKMPGTYKFDCQLIVTSDAPIISEIVFLTAGEVLTFGIKSRDGYSNSFEESPATLMWHKSASINISKM